MPLAITLGEPAGIGADLVLLLACQQSMDDVVVVGNKALLESRKAELGLEVALEDYAGAETSRAGTSKPTLQVLSMPLSEPVQAGRLNPANASYVLSLLDRAIAGCQSGEFSAMVTAPVHKGVINDAGITFSGHTEYLEQQTDSQKVVMMLATEGLKVALVTTHLPLRAVADAITSELFEEVLTVLIEDLRRKFGVAHPTILVAGLNPHAGEGGHMGREEIEILEPVMSRFQNEAVTLVGPLPADTLFTEKYLATADAVLAMYHDQGLPVLKYKGFGEAVNITLGLPIIRTSVDHGTALDLAATGQVNTGSLRVALAYAREMSASRLQSQENSVGEN